MSDESKVTKKHVSDKDFVQAYKLYKSYDELAEAIGLTPASVAIRANRLRKAGVGLLPYARAKYVRAKKVVDVAGLNSLLS